MLIIIALSRLMFIIIIVFIAKRNLSKKSSLGRWNFDGLQFIFFIFIQVHIVGTRNALFTSFIFRRLGGLGIQKLDIGGLYNHLNCQWSTQPKCMMLMAV